MVSELHAGKGEVCSEARVRASLDGEVARDIDASREHARVDRVAADKQHPSAFAARPERAVRREAHLKHPRDSQRPTEGTTVGGGGGATPFQ